MEEMWLGGLVDAEQKTREMRGRHAELKSVPYHLDHATYLMEDGTPVRANIVGLDLEEKSVAMLQVDAHDIDPQKQGISIFTAERSEKPEPNKWYWLPVQVQLDEIDGDEEADEIRPEVAELMRQELYAYSTILGWTEAQLQAEMRASGIITQTNLNTARKHTENRWKVNPKPFSGNAGQKKRKRR